MKLEYHITNIPLVIYRYSQKHRMKTPVSQNPTVCLSSHLTSCSSPDLNKSKKDWPWSQNADETTQSFQSFSPLTSCTFVILLYSNSCSTTSVRFLSQSRSWWAPVQPWMTWSQPCSPWRSRWMERAAPRPRCWSDILTTLMCHLLCYAGLWLNRGCKFEVKTCQLVIIMGRCLWWEILHEMLQHTHTHSLTSV